MWGYQGLTLWPGPALPASTVTSARGHSGRSGWGGPPGPGARPPGAWVLHAVRAPSSHPGALAKCGGPAGGLGGVMHSAPTVESTWRFLLPTLVLAGPSPPIGGEGTGSRSGSQHLGVLFSGRLLRHRVSRVGPASPGPQLSPHLAKANGSVAMETSVPITLCAETQV